MTVYKVLIVGLGGFFGSATRYATTRFIDDRLNTFFPFGTFTVNLAGSFVLGLVFALATRKPEVTEHWRLFLGAGFCGGFTTFSAFTFENLNLLQQKMIPTAAVYIALSLFAGIAAVAFGAWVSRFF
ncbi:MAG TPA: fluoride efflux transporter CrcB [Ohtaekwangia sp.]|nr:fluoride efflux transporter CrcB [Ohtaekwangia sp.]